MTKHGVNKAKDVCTTCKHNGDPEYKADTARTSVDRRNGVKRKRNRTNVKHKLINEQI